MAGQLEQQGHGGGVIGIVGDVEKYVRSSWVSGGVEGVSPPESHGEQTIAAESSAPGAATRVVEGSGKSRPEIPPQNSSAWR